MAQDKLGPCAGQSAAEWSRARRAATHQPLSRCSPCSPSAAGARGADSRHRAHERAARSPRSRHLEDMEQDKGSIPNHSGHDTDEVTQERRAEANANVDSSVPPSVAQLAGRFREQAAAAKETPASKPTRRKPPCSLPLFPPKVELGQNGEEKSPPSASHPPKIKVKSSPLIEKLQANLAFDPAALLPGASPKSPGLKAAVSPINSPPSTPSSPGVRSRSSEPEEVPVSFDQPPEGSHLPCYNKVRTRGSIKRRPPSRRFRRSQSDCGDLGDFRAPESAQENGAKEENGDEVFTSKSKTPETPPSSEGVVGKEVRRSLGSDEKGLLRRTSSRTEKPEETGKATEEAKPGEKAEEHPSPAQGEVMEPLQSSSPKAENGCGSPMEETTAGEDAAAEKSAEVKEERARNEKDTPAQKSQDTKKLEERAGGQEAPPNPTGEEEEGNPSEKQKNKEKQEKRGGVLQTGGPPGTEPGPPETSGEALSGEAVPEAEDDTLVQDTKM
ncbi:PREDICTED: capZ-interacting protein [Elephantulus edwardii]|uniref:capZ-interacting protein n=1 Tax=Elephantulus edwardii TaxID=28737 RepID=UPI0003F07B27|nr:PREDICTED: capZ-interacting protein [Elephantulus edwardii]